MLAFLAPSLCAGHSVEAVKQPLANEAWRTSEPVKALTDTVSPRFLHQPERDIPTALFMWLRPPTKNGQLSLLPVLCVLG